MGSSKEIWKPIKDYEKHYAISNFGRVKSLPRSRPYRNTTRIVKERILKPHLKGDKSKYLTVLLSKDNEKRFKKIHHLVLEAFVGKRPPGAVARHLDDCTENNSYDNLAWGTVSENTKDKFSNGYRHHRLVLSDSEICKVRKSIGDHSVIADKFNVSKRTVGRIKNEEGYYGKF